MDEKKGIAKIAKYFVNFQYGLSIVMALLLLAMIGYEVVMRYVFKSSLMGVEEVMVFPIIWLYMLGGANASYEKSHIECGILTLYIKKEHSMLIFNLVKRIICCEYTTINTTKDNQWHNQCRNRLKCLGTYIFQIFIGWLFLQYF